MESAALVEDPDLVTARDALAAALATFARVAERLAEQHSALVALATRALLDAGVRHLSLTAGRET
jgi:hypothetical protein